MSRNEAVLAVSVESFISSAMRKTRSPKYQNLQLFSERTSSILVEHELKGWVNFYSPVRNLPLTSSAVTRREGKYN